jgi:hypothetical protein
LEAEARALEMRASLPRRRSRRATEVPDRKPDNAKEA